jgi:hypothetical protein
VIGSLEVDVIQASLSRIERMIVRRAPPLPLRLGAP